MSETRRHDSGDKPDPCRRRAVRGLLFAAAVGGSFMVGEFGPARPTVLAAAKTGKERLGDKASDEQRVNDCKVPNGRRTRVRPTSCEQ
jgi:hypothetical protein